MKALLLLLALGACGPTLMVQSGPPPGRSARLDAVRGGFWNTIKSYRAEVSQGVALAVSCENGGPCEKLVVTSDDLTIAEVRPASLATLTPGFSVNQQPTSAFVVVGKAAGTTKVHVRSKDGGRDVLVTVVPQPAPIQQATVAR